MRWSRARARGADASGLRYLTVVTYGRTGSTALQASLNALPGVLVRGENYNALRGLHDYARAVAQTADRHHAGRPTHPWYGSARLDPNLVLDDLRDHVLRTVLRPRPETAVIGFKEIRYEPGHFASYESMLDYLLFLGELLPGLTYLVNVRSPQDAARSGWWPDNDRALDVLSQTRDRLVLATDEINDVQGRQVAWRLDYADWAGRPEVLIDTYRAMGLPRDDAAVRSALGERLDHGPHGSSA